MSRTRMYIQYDVPNSVVDIVKTLCADYHRRARAIRCGKVTGVVLTRYMELNAVIDEALEDVEVGIRMDMLADIQARRGYGLSPISCCIAKGTYYKRKKKLIYDIAKSLALV